jgi:hypothetical protein
VPDAVQLRLVIGQAASCGPVRATARTPSCPGRSGHPQDMETGGYPDRGVCAAVDVHHLSTDGARAAAVLAADAAFAHVLAERTALVPRVAPYRPGEFYLRELPPLRAVLADLDRLARLTTMQAGTSQAGHRRVLRPPRSSSGGGACRRTAPWGPQGCSPGRRARLPHQRACTGGSRLWFPALRLAFQKESSNWRILVGAGGFEPPASRL